MNDKHDCIEILENSTSETDRALRNAFKLLPHECTREQQIDVLEAQGQRLLTHQSKTVQDAFYGYLQAYPELLLVAKSKGLVKKLLEIASNTNCSDRVETIVRLMCNASLRANKQELQVLLQIPTGVDGVEVFLTRAKRDDRLSKETKALCNEALRQIQDEENVSHHDDRAITPSSYKLL